MSSLRPSSFDIDIEIDECIDKLAEVLKVKIKKLVQRSERDVLKQYIEQQKSELAIAKKSNKDELRKQRELSSTHSRFKRESDYKMNTYSSGYSSSE